MPPLTPMLRQAEVDTVVRNVQRWSAPRTVHASCAPDSMASNPDKQTVWERLELEVLVDLFICTEKAGSAILSRSIVFCWPVDRCDQ
jgi:hypothetical protein